MLSSSPPAQLVSLQRWFAKTLTEVEPPKDAASYIAPSSKLTSEQRLHIYHQQYWWRLLGILHENFPALTRLFGYSDFNISIATPFLAAFPSRHWSLTKLGDRMTKWIETSYQAPDKPLILSMAELDWAYQEVFFAPAPVSSSLDITTKLRLQPHVKIFQLPFDLFAYRTALLKQPVEFWTDSDFPPLPKEKIYFFVLYRTIHNLVYYHELSRGEGTLLHLIQSGLSIEEACDHLENESEEAATSIGSWVQNWVREKWLIKD